MGDFGCSTSWLIRSLLQLYMLSSMVPTPYQLGGNTICTGHRLRHAYNWYVIFDLLLIKLLFSAL